MKKINLLTLLILLFVNSACTKSGRRDRIHHDVGQGYKQNKLAKSTSDNTLKSKNMTGSEIFAKYSSAVFMVYTSDGTHHYQGSGFFIGNGGLAVSNYHVFQGTSIGCEQIKLSDNKLYKVTLIIAKSAEEDFILFKVAVKENTFIPISYSLPSVGEKIYTIGSPRGLENTFSSGEISQIREGRFIQISAPIDHGSSGGALINAHGELIGITSGGTDDSNANLNFAKSIEVVKKYVE